MDLVRLTVSPSLMSWSDAEDHDTDVVDFEVQRHPADAAGEFDHLAGLHVVQAVDAGNPVADRQHAANFGHFGILAEVLDLLLQDRRDLSSLDSHYPTSFIAFCSAASFARTEVSIIVEPSLTTRPPIRLSSTVVFSFTSLPTRAFSVAASLSVCAAVSARADGDLGGHFALLGGDAGRAVRRSAAAARTGGACPPSAPACSPSAPTGPSSRQSPRSRCPDLRG